MSNKPKGVKSLKGATELTSVEKAYNAFVRNMVDFAKNRCEFSKHVGSKSPRVLKQRIYY